MNKKYSVTTYWLLPVRIKTEHKFLFSFVNRWKRVSKDYFRTKKEAVAYASRNAMFYVKTTIRREGKRRSLLRKYSIKKV